MQQCTVGRGLQPTVDLASNDLREMGEAAAVITIQRAVPTLSNLVTAPDQIGATAAFLMGRDGSFITGTDLLIDGGVIAAIAAGRYQLNMAG
jgi:NAD(P)-dependent dehydrogenase (short-subunit alcohol dehydrogenase family)